MSASTFGLIYFIYGLSFFTMGLIIVLEGGRGSDERLRHALRPLAGFGLIHGIHEWIELFEIMGLLSSARDVVYIWQGIRLAMLAFSFISLSAFGASLLSPTPQIRRYSMLLPLIQCGVWGVGVLLLRDQFSLPMRMWDAADVWTRYVIGIPSALVACLGLIAQQRAFRRAGMARFGRDSLWAAVAFAWYGLVGQIFTRPSNLFPSTVVNQDLFFSYFGFPVQVLRMFAASIAAAFVIRFLRASEVESQHQIANLQEERLREARRRESMRGELYKRVVAAQEAERQRIARELHDETGQALTAIGLGLRGATTSLQVDTSLTTQHLRQLEDLSSNALDELQRLISDLRPSHLDDLGLSAALRWYLNEVQERSRLNIEVTFTGEAEDLLPPVRIAVYRIVQEAITNVIKHAKATHAWVRIEYQEENIETQIEDNGVGFYPPDLERDERSPWGILGMRERANLMHGNFQLDSQTGLGTRITVTIPYEGTKQTGGESIHDY